MHIQLTDGYFIESDNYNLILKQTKVHKSGKEKGEIYENVVGYYGNLSETVKAYLKRAVMDDIESADIQAIADKTESIINEKAKEIAENVSRVSRETIGKV